MTAKLVIDFWFSNQAKWFDKDANFDNEIKENFLEAYNLAIEGKLDSWQDEPQSLLALVIILDQFTRNMFRDRPEAFSGDEKARKLTAKALGLGFDKKLTIPERKFLYMPLMHSELLADQDLCVSLFSELEDEYSLRYAKAHRDIIARFGRFPHRNKILNRTSTKEELEFLTQPGSSF